MYASVQVFFSGHMLLFLLSKYLEMELLGSKITLYLTFKELLIYFTKQCTIVNADEHQAGYSMTAAFQKVLFGKAYYIKKVKFGRLERFTVGRALPCMYVSYSHLNHSLPYNTQSTTKCNS